MHILLAELVTAIFFVWLAVEAVYHENAFELLASAVVACGIAARFIFFMVSLGKKKGNQRLPIVCSHCVMSSLGSMICHLDCFLKSMTVFIENQPCLSENHRNARSSSKHEAARKQILADEEYKQQCGALLKSDHWGVQWYHMRT